MGLASTNIMLGQEPDMNAGALELEAVLNVIQRGLNESAHWQCHEEYIDNGILDPYYILKIRRPLADKGDSVYDQTLRKSAKSGLSYVNRTAQHSKTYWIDISAKQLLKRLQAFKKRFDLNQFQAPGLKGHLTHPKEQHEIFQDKRFIYEIQSPFKSLTAIGPAKYAMGPGAVCGTVYNESGTPLDDAVVELTRENKVLSRTTKGGGLFWFSKVPSGSYTIRVNERSSVIQIIRRDEYGNIKGWLSDADGNPVDSTKLNFRAPDGELFSASSDDTGNFTTGPLPALPYIMEIPSFMFSIKKSVYVKDAIIAGTLRDNRGNALAGETIILKQKGVELAQTNADEHGHFRFFELTGGEYELEVPDEKIYLSTSLAGRIEGKKADGSINETRIELIAEGKVVATERLNKDKEFEFEDVAVGEYEVNYHNEEDI